MKIKLLFALSFVCSMGVSAQTPTKESLNKKFDKPAAVFEENKGQMKDQHWNPRPDVLFYGSQEGMNYYIKNNGVSFQLSKVDSWRKEESRPGLMDLENRQVPDQVSTYRVDAHWLSYNTDFTSEVGKALDGYNNYYNVPEGIDPALFVKQFESVTLKNVWNGIDIHYYGTDGLLETDYLIAPGADYSQIKMVIQGAELSTSADGRLIMKTPFGEIHEGELKVFQGDQRLEAYWKISEGNVVSFEVPDYNPMVAMRIDPLMRAWGTYYGGTNEDYVYSIDADGAGNIYVGGLTNSSSFISAGGFQNTIGGDYDAFVAKINSAGLRQWGTYYGGNLYESASSVVISSTNDIFLAGYTNSLSSISFNGHQNNLNGLSDGFLVKFNSAGVRDWATYYGGILNEFDLFVATDSNGNAYLCGSTQSTSSIAFNGHQNSPGGNYDGFLVKFNNTGTLQWGTYYGGGAIDYGLGVSTDSSGNIFLCGLTYGSTIGIASAGHQNGFGGGTDGFLVKFNNQGARQWGTYYGGVNSDNASSVSTDSQGNVFISGTTTSTNGIAFNGFQNFIGSTSWPDAYLVKFNGGGVRQWGTYLGGSQLDACYSNCTDVLGNVYISGKTKSTNGIASNGFKNSYTPGGLVGEDGFLVKFNGAGIRMWGTYYGGTNDDVGIISSADPFGGVFLSGYTLSNNSISTANGHQSQFQGGTSDGFVVKFNQARINGLVWQDFNSNCIKDVGENGIVDRIALVIQPGNIVTQAIDGVWSIDSLPIGTYTITIDTTKGNWLSTCNVSQQFSVTNSNGFTNGPDFGLLSTVSCNDPDISIAAPFLRRCFGNQTIYVSACNSPTATGSLDTSYVIIKLDNLLTLGGSSIPYTAIGNNIFRFETGDIFPGQCVDFTLSASVSCNAINFQTLCMEAALFPVDSCVFDTIPNSGGGGSGSGGGVGGGISCNLPWDRSSLRVEGYCQNDSACFVIRNVSDPGAGDMVCYSQIRIYVDGVLTVIDSLQLAGGDSLTYCYFANGQTIRLEVDQHPLHPGNSQPNAVVELCGNPNNWTPGLVTSQPQDDADPIVDIYCGVVTGSYDPNDKIGYPTGLTTQNYIQPNQQLQYMIRFQNTGNDTAFTVVVRDTLDPNLNIFTVTTGVASHPYSFRMYGPRVLEWTFDNILLPDSNVNEPGSHGFVTFHVEQVPNLPQGTTIANDADIYFDFNQPITTNNYEHQIFIGSPLGVDDNPSIQENNLSIFPNPTTGTLSIKTPKFINETYSIMDLQGRKLMGGNLTDVETEITVDLLNQGVYILRLEQSLQSVIFIKQ